MEVEIQKAAEEKRKYFSFKHRLANGKIRDFEVYSGPMVFNSQSLLYYIVHDITERRRAEEALRLSNIFNRSLIEASLDPLVTIGPDGKIMDVNGATELVTGDSRDELMGTYFSNYFTEPEEASKEYQQVFVIVK
jgi:PAS domain-containing protein